MILLLAALTAGGCARPQAGLLDHAALGAALNEAVPAALTAGNIPGAVILVGKVDGSRCDVWQRAWGLMSVEPQAVPMPVDAIFDLASMTKPIATGTCLMLLIEQGRVGLEDPVGKYLPEFATGIKAGVTVRHLMTHISGMLPYLGAPGQKAVRDQAGFPCPAAIRARIRSLELANSPGCVVVYSCLNAILCAEIVEKVTGQELDRFAAEQVFGPLRMTSTGFNLPDEMRGRIVPTTVAEHGRGPGGFLQGQVHDPLAALQGGVSGNAGLFSSAADLARFARMVLGGGELDGVRILRPETVRAMATVMNPGVRNSAGRLDRRGLLWDIYGPDPGDLGVDALAAFGHTGYTGTAIRFYPQQGVFAIVLTNRVHPDDSAKVEDLRRLVWNTVGRCVLGVADEDAPASP